MSVLRSGGIGIGTGPIPPVETFLYEQESNLFLFEQENSTDLYELE